MEGKHIIQATWRILISQKYPKIFVRLPLKRRKKPVKLIYPPNGGHEQINRGTFWQ
jgi:hypothetical protein